MDVQGVVKSTVVRGEDDFPSGLLRVSDCHDSILYALAPLQYTSITCCSDCTVVREGWEAMVHRGAHWDRRDRQMWRAYPLTVSDPWTLPKLLNRPHCL